MKNIIFVIVFAILAYILSIVSEATQDSALICSYIAGGIELILYLIALPLASYTGKKIRENSTGKGNPGLRLVSWIMYGVAIPHALLFFNWGLIASGNNRIPNGQIPVNSVIFFVAAMLMIADAWNSYKNKGIK
jgi:hypothetical protein